MRCVSLCGLKLPGALGLRLKEVHIRWWHISYVWTVVSMAVAAEMTLCEIAWLVLHRWHFGLERSRAIALPARLLVVLVRVASACADMVLPLAFAP